MDNKRRQILRKSLDCFNIGTSLIEEVLDKEEECVSNIPENLQNSDKYERMEEIIDILEETLEKIEDIKESIESALK